MARRRMPGLVLVGLAALAATLIVTILLKYPPQLKSHALGAGVGLAAILLLAACALRFGAVPKGRGCACRPGFIAGALGGGLWVLEIGYNNLISARVVTTDLTNLARTRDRIDDIFWASVALIVFLAAVQTGRQTRHWRQGVAAGAWAGVISGLVACVTALLLIVGGMPLLLGDPLNVGEAAHRGLAQTGRGIETYFAYETMAGALVHLLVLGAGMGTILGVIGGGIGKLLRRGE